MSRGPGTRVFVRPRSPSRTGRRKGVRRDTTLITECALEPLEIRFARLPFVVRLLLIASTYMLAISIALVSHVLHVRAVAQRSTVYIASGSPPYCVHAVGAAHVQVPPVHPEQDWSSATNASTKACVAAGNMKELGLSRLPTR
jgi:hypothetical protein